MSLKNKIIAHAVVGYSAELILIYFLLSIDPAAFAVEMLILLVIITYAMGMAIKLEKTLENNRNNYKKNT